MLMYHVPYDERHKIVPGDLVTMTLNGEKKLGVVLSFNRWGSGGYEVEMVQEDPRYTMVFRRWMIKKA